MSEPLSQSSTSRAPSPPRTRALVTSVVALVTSLGVGLALGCRTPPAPDSSNGPAPASAAPSAIALGSASASAVPATEADKLADAVPVPQVVIDAEVNPTGKPAYTGPFGDIAGIVTVKGDPSPDVKLVNRIPRGCGEAAALYRKLFRAGANGELSDAIVAATDFGQYVPTAIDAHRVRIHGCAYDARTIVMTFGERLEVTNGDGVPYMPSLYGANATAEMIAMPGGDAIKLYPPEPKLYVLKDDLLHPWMHADVYVLKYATHDVTAIDGRYHLARVPVGKVKLSVRHPSIPHTIEQMVDVKEGETTHVDVVIPFDATKDAPQLAASASASAKPVRAPK